MLESERLQKPDTLEMIWKAKVKLHKKISGKSFEDCFEETYQDVRVKPTNSVKDLAVRKIPT